MAYDSRRFLLFSTLPIEEKNVPSRRSPSASTNIAAGQDRLGEVDIDEVVPV